MNLNSQIHKIFLRILMRKFQEYIAHVNTLKLIPLEDFETGILKNSTTKLLEYIVHACEQRFMIK